jgi:hypothetical protein
LKKAPQCNIVATFVKKIYKDNDESYIYEYFDRETFDLFISSKENRPNGILQSFVQPKGDFNCKFPFVIKKSFS